MIPFLLPILAAAAPIQDAPADPLAPAREGRIRCVAPNMELRTCQAMIRYTPRGADGFDATVLAIIERDPVVLIQYETFGRIEQGGICGMVRASDFESGKLMKGGKPMTAADVQFVRLRLMDAAEPIIGKKRCFIDRPDAGKRTISTVVTLNGVAQNEQAQTVTWVEPGEKFALGL
jgi:hypothetical protein